MPRLIDLTHGFYEGMPSYPAPWFPKFTAERAMTPENDPNGTERTFSTLHLFPHNATHIEYRLHFYPGAEGIDAVPLETLIGRACVADLSHKGDLDPVTGEDLEKELSEVWQRGDRLLIRTDYVRRAWGREDYWDKPPYLTRPGDNRSLVSYYASSGARLTGATLDGQPVTVGNSVERGHTVYTLDMELPAQSSRTLTLDLLEPISNRTPVLLDQPLVTPTRARLEAVSVCE